MRLLQDTSRQLRTVQGDRVGTVCKALCHVCRPVHPQIQRVRNWTEVEEALARLGAKAGNWGAAGTAITSAAPMKCCPQGPPVTTHCPASGQGAICTAKVASKGLKQNSQS